MGVTTRLLKLQALDLEIDRLVARQRALESGVEVAKAREAADTAEEAVGELRLQRDSLDRDGSKVEHEIDSLQQKTKAEEQRLFSGAVANAKELASIQHEVDNLKKRISEREDELLVILEIREGLEARIKEAEQAFEEARSAADRFSATAAAELSTVTADLADRRDARVPIAAEIDPDLLGLYEEIRPQKKGVAAAALTDGVCQGCHETLSKVELDRVKHTEDLPRCEYCRRILVL